MERKTLFIDVILPLALPKPLTYRVPFESNDYIRVGQRVVVQLGKSKLYTGIVKLISEKAPDGYSAKYIEGILDEHAIVNESQLRLWAWIASYYCCTEGEVMNAALPSGLKLSSETKFSLQEGVHLDQLHLSEKEETIVNALFHRGAITMDDAASILNQKGAQSIMSSLMSKGIVCSEEELKEKYKPRLIDFVHLGPAAASEQNLQVVFADLEKRRAQKQSDVLLKFLQLSNWDEGKSAAIERSKLQQETGAAASVIAAMAEKGIFSIEQREIGRLAQHLLAAEASRELSTAQQKAFDESEKGFEEKDIVLLHGVTSSGKTEIYVKLIEEKLKENKQVLFLLPEIALTTQIIQRLRKFFGKRVGVYHSGYSDNERTEVWNKVLADTPGECDVILGARSSLFLPFTRLGLVIVDEEHEQSFKQHDPSPRYHARDSAIVLASMFKAKVLLGSATPAVESYWNALKDRYRLVELNERFGGIELPEIIVSDLRPETKAKKLVGSFSSALMLGMEQEISAGKQIILFQNRRGYSPLWQCDTCGWTPMCTRCDVSMTYHKGLHQLKCHYCGYYSAPPTTCMACQSHDIRMIGFGTEKIEEDISGFLPEVKVQRMDLDTTRSKSSYQKIISDFESGHTQVLVGTQMVTKGLDFDNVSLVGILNADKMMHYPDYRSMERSYQLMMQVAGRAGRKGKQGKVIIQTYTPDHWMFELLRNGDYMAMYNHEIRERQIHGYPPFIRMIKVLVKHKQDDVVDAAAHLLSKKLKEIVGERLLGPERPYIPRINNYYLRQFIIKLDKTPELPNIKAQILHEIRSLAQDQKFKSVRTSIDVDPL